MPRDLVQEPSARRRSRNAAGRPGPALAWSFGNTLLSKLGALAIGVALARVLGPAEFGSYAVAFIALMAILAFNDLGVTLAVVRWEEDPEDVAPTVNTVSILSSLALTACILFAAGPFARSMGDPEAAPLVRLLAVCVVVNAIVATPAAVLQRYFRADLRTYADQVNVWLGAFVSLGLAVSGMGAMSLVVGRLTGAGVSALMLLAFSPIPYRLGWDRQLVPRLLRFGLPLAGASLLVFAIGFVDQLAVGRALGPIALGVYVLAYNLSSWPVHIISQPLRNVAPAILARQQHDPPLMRRTFQQMALPLGIVAIPGCVAMAVAAPDLVVLVYGDEWRAAAVPLRWLALFAAFRILFELCYDFVVIAGNSRSLLAVQLLWLAGLVPLVTVAVTQYGVEGAAAAQVLLGIVVIAPAYLVILRRLRVSVTALLGSFLWPGVGAAVLAGVTLGVQASRASSLEVLTAVACAGALVVGGLTYRFRAEFAVWRRSGAASPGSLR